MYRWYIERHSTHDFVGGARDGQGTVSQVVCDVAKKHTSDGQINDACRRRGRRSMRIAWDKPNSSEETTEESRMLLRNTPEIRKVYGAFGE